MASGELTALGFSNGANIAAAMLLRRPESLAGGALLRAMVPLSERPDVDLRGKRILLLSGAVDPIIPPANAARLATIFREAGADVEAETLPAGHGLTPQDISLTQTWIASAGALSRRNYSGMLSCFFQGRSTSLARSMASARAIRRRVECGMITSSI